MVEFGAGSQTKTPLLLAAIHPTAYVPIDISGDYLEDSAADARRRPCADRRSIRSSPISPSAFALARRDRRACRGSASSPARPSAISCRAARPTCCAISATSSAPASKLLIGMDRIKPVERLIAAYDDPEGVTAAVQPQPARTASTASSAATFPVDAFVHEARWNDMLARIEMHLVATARRRLHDRRPALRLRARARPSTPRTATNTARAAARLLLLAGGWTPLAEWVDPDGDFALDPGRGPAQPLRALIAAAQRARLSGAP